MEFSSKLIENAVNEISKLLIKEFNNQKFEIILCSGSLKFIEDK